MNLSEVRETVAEGFLFASAQSPMRPGEASKLIFPLLDEVYAFLKASGTPHLGINVAVYDGSDPAGLVMKAGVRVRAEFTGNGRVTCSRTPSGPAVTTLLRGPYDRIRGANEAIAAWAHQRGRDLGPLSWEVYGHAAPNPEEQETEIWWLLR